jgi:hypothetical protein
MQIYYGANCDVYTFEQGDSNYLAQHNIDLKALADHNHTNNPIHGTTAIQAGTITAASITDGTITSGKLAAQLSVSTLSNNSYLKWRNQADNADVNTIRLNTSDKLEFGPDIATFRLQHNTNFKGATAAAGDHNLFKINTGDQWEFLNTAYSQNVLAKTTNTYTLGDATHVYSKNWAQNFRLTDYSASLDFYEAGTWTPVIAGSSAGGSGTYTFQNGYYTRIGRICILHFAVNWSAHTGTGNLLISGDPALPFSAAAVTNQIATGTAFMGSITMPAGDMTFLEIAAGDGGIQVATNVSGAGQSAVAMDTSGDIRGTLVYIV